MSEQIREQVSAFLDGELPNSETELFLKRLIRDGDLRERFGRYALIGEALRGASRAYLTKGFAERVNLSIDGEPVSASLTRSPGAHLKRWWRPFAGAAVAAGVAAVAVVALQQRAVAPGVRMAAAPVAAASAAGEPLSYTVPTSSSVAPVATPGARLTNYVFAHSQYSSPLGQRGVLADLLIEDEEQPPNLTAAAHVAP